MIGGKPPHLKTNSPIFHWFIIQVYLGQDHKILRERSSRKTERPELKFQQLVAAEIGSRPVNSKESGKQLEIFTETIEESYHRRKVLESKVQVLPWTQANCTKPYNALNHKRSRSALVTYFSTLMKSNISLKKIKIQIYTTQQ